MQTAGLQSLHRIEEQRLHSSKHQHETMEFLTVRTRSVIKIERNVLDKRLGGVGLVKIVTVTYKIQWTEQNLITPDSYMVAKQTT